MEIEIAGVLGFVFAATTIVALICERQTDVLHGPYIAGRVRLRTAGLICNPLLFLLDQLGRRAIYMTTLA